MGLIRAASRVPEWVLISGVDWVGEEEIERSIMTVVVSMVKTG